MLSSKKTLKEQGLSDASSVSYLYEPASLHDAWKLLHSAPVEDRFAALDGLRHLQGIWSLNQLRELPESLQSLQFAQKFNQSLERMKRILTTKILTKRIRSKGRSAKRY